MNLMIDTNIFLDVLLKREPFFENSEKTLKLCEEKKIQGFLSASSITDLYYIIHKFAHNKETTYKALGNILDIARVLTVSNEDVLNAYLKKANDFEDSLLVTCALANKCEAIVTRNKKDFEEHNKVIEIHDGIWEMKDTTQPYGFVAPNAKVWF